MDDVYEGEAVRVDWLYALREDVRTRHSTPDGEPLVHLAEEPVLFRRYKSMLFRKEAPWVSVMNTKLLACVVRFTYYLV